MPFCPQGKSAVSPVIKYTLLVGTFLHWLSGLAMVGIGSWAFMEKNKYFYQPIEDVYDVLFDMSIVMIVFGGIMFIITMCGFVGALRENTCLLRFFYYSLGVIFLLELIGGILGFAFKDKAIEFINGILQNAYVDRYQDQEDAVIDWFHENFKCCGISSYTDWNRNEYFNCTATNPSPLKCSVPYSCCKNPQDLSPGLNNILCGGGALSSNSTTVFKIHTDGCVQKILTLAEENLPLVAGVIIAIAIPQLMGIILGHIFANQIETQWVIYRKSQARGRRH